mmetsp:Transcript_1233/g.3065  ORF Transcript_1233/g.3065 Transcript_1233/m.3065 type:complete len:268 (+) Transcript_1233:738-1541(+)
MSARRTSSVMGRPSRHPSPPVAPAVSSSSPLFFATADDLPTNVRVPSASVTGTLSSPRRGNRSLPPSAHRPSSSSSFRRPLLFRPHERHSAMRSSRSRNRTSCASAPPLPAPPGGVTMWLLADDARLRPLSRSSSSSSSSIESRSSSSSSPRRAAIPSFLFFQPVASMVVAPCFSAPTLFLPARRHPERPVYRSNPYGSSLAARSRCGGRGAEFESEVGGAVEIRRGTAELSPSPVASSSSSCDGPSLPLATTATVGSTFALSGCCA